MRRNLGEDKVEQPLCGRTHGHATFANTAGENLSRVELEQKNSRLVVSSFPTLGARIVSGL